MEPEVLEFDSFTESLLDNLAVGGGCLGCGTLVFMFLFRNEAFVNPSQFAWAAGGLAVFLVAAWLRARVDMTLVLDPQREQVLYRRSLFGWVTLTPLASFRDLQCVTESGREVHQKNKPSYWESALFLVTNQGRRIRASNYQQSPTYPDPALLAQRLGVRHLAGGRQSYLVIRQGQAEHSDREMSDRTCGLLVLAFFVGWFVIAQLYLHGILTY